jgi:hypothetical protein
LLCFSFFNVEYLNVSCAALYLSVNNVAGWPALQPSMPTRPALYGFAVSRPNNKLINDFVLEALDTADRAGVAAPTHLGENTLCQSAVEQLSSSS